MLPAESPFIIPSAEKFPPLQEYGPHIVSLRLHCLWPDPPVELPVNFAQVLSDTGTYMWRAGKLTEGEEALETAVDIIDRNGLEKGSPLRADALQVLGIMSSFEVVSERKKSMELRYEVLAARELAYEDIPQNKVARDDEFRRWIVDSDVAYGLVQQEDFKAADAIMQGCLEKYDEWGTEDGYPY